jgi:hypothetical protein
MKAEKFNPAKTIEKTIRNVIRQELKEYKV